MPSIYLKPSERLIKVKNECGEDFLFTELVRILDECEKRIIELESELSSVRRFAGVPSSSYPFPL